MGKPEMSAAEVAEYNQRMASRTRKEKFNQWVNDGNGNVSYLILHLIEKQ